MNEEFSEELILSMDMIVVADEEMTSALSVQTFPLNFG